jgi:nucleoside-diphosphate-sugar epimerase
MELAARWSLTGHHVVGTTTRPERVPELRTVCAEVAVLVGTEQDKVRAVVEGADAVVIAVAPRAAHFLSRRDRAVEYRAALIGTTRSVVAAHHRVLLLSSIVVYGDGSPAAARSGRGPADAPVDEHTPLSIELEPAAQSYGTAERMVLEKPDGAVLRLPDVYGDPRRPDPVSQLRYARAEVGGELPFAGDAPHYRIDYRDAAAAAAFVVDRGLSGVYNAVPDDVVPPTYAAETAALLGPLGLPPVRFRGEIKQPTRPISSWKLRAEGFAFEH